MAQQILILLQILTGEQKALSLVKAFPYIADEPRLFETLAAQRNAAPLAVLTQPSGPDDLEYNTNWLQVAVYLRSISRQNLVNHVPFIVGPVAG